MTLAPKPDLLIPSMSEAQCLPSCHPASNLRIILLSPLPPGSWLPPSEDSEPIPSLCPFCGRTSWHSVMAEPPSSVLPPLWPPPLSLDPVLLASLHFLEHSRLFLPPEPGRPLWGSRPVFSHSHLFRVLALLSCCCEFFLREKKLLGLSNYKADALLPPCILLRAPILGVGSRPFTLSYVPSFF